MSESKSLLRVKAVRGRNCAILESFDLQFDKDKHLIPVRGKNGAGKTTFLNILRSMQGGASAIAAEPVTHGQEDGFHEIELEPIDGNGDVVEITRKFNDEGKKSLTVMEGDRAKNQTYLSGLVGELRDPLAFTAMEGKKLTEAVMKMVDLGDFSLSDNRAELKAAEDRRTDQGREVKRIKGSVDSLKKELGSFDKAAPGLSALMDEIQAANDLRSAAQIKANAAAALDETLKNSSLNHLAHDVSIDNECALIESLKVQIEEAEGSIVEFRREKRLAYDKVQSDTKALAAAKKAAAKAEKAVPDMEALNAKRESAQANDAKRQQAKIYETAKADHKAAEKEYAARAERIEGLREAAKVALSAATWPANGMSFDNDAEVLRLHGARWEQSGSGEKFTAAVEIALAQPSVLQALWVKDASLMDDDRLQHLDQLMVEKNCWAFLEMVDSKPPEGEKDGVAILDGVASNL